MTSSSDLQRTAQLIVGADEPLDVMPRSLRAAAARGRTGPAPVRALQRVAMRRGRLGIESAIVAREQARRDVLGDRAAGPPRFLVRVDEYPHWLADDQPVRYGTEAFLRFHDIMASADVPYLIAVVARPSQDPMDPARRDDRPLSDAELDVLRRVQADGVQLGVHGLDHRTRDIHPRRQSELLGRSPDELRERFAQADDILAPIAPEPLRTFVPPWNRFTRAQYDVLAERYDIIGGGPETVMQLGFHAGPTWWGDAVYLPSYAPFYAHAGGVEPAARAAVARNGGGWIPIVLHWGWETEDRWDALKRLAATIGGYTERWSTLLAEIDAIRAADRPAS